MLKTAVLRKNPDMVSRVIDDETILLPIYKSSNEINCIYSLNDIASKVWALIDGKRTLPQIKQQILKKFDATSPEVDREMNKFLKDLREIRAIK